MITPEFLEKYRAKGMSDQDIDRTYLEASGDKEYKKFRDMFTSKYGHSSTGTLLDFMAYGTVNPPQTQQEEPQEQGKTWSGILGDIGVGALKQASKMIPGALPFAQQSVQPDRAGLGDVVSTAAGKVGDVMDVGAGRAVESVQASLAGEQTPLETVTQVAAGAAGTAAKAAQLPIEPLLKAAGYVIPDSVKEGFMNDPLVQKTMEGIGSLMEAYDGLKDTNPRLARNLQAALDAGEGALTFLGVTKAPALAGAQIGKQQAKSAAKRLAGVDKIIDEGIAKGVKPTVIGKKTLQRSQEFNERSREAVKSIINRKGSLSMTNEIGEEIVGRTPSNLMQFAQAIEQTKKGVYSEYSQLAKQATKAGIQIDVSDIAKSLDDVISNRATQIANPAVISHAKKLRDELISAGKMGPDEMDDLIKQWNSSLQGFYVGRGDKAIAQVEGSLAKISRKKLDDAIEQATGNSGFQALKNEYGALRTLEEEVAKRAIVDARKAAKGFFDMTDIFTGGELISGLLTSNPASIIKGAAGRGIKERIKFLTDPNNIVRKMFEDVDSILSAPR
jgi:hypothetical protein